MFRLRVDVGSGFTARHRQRHEPFARLRLLDGGIVRYLEKGGFEFRNDGLRSASRHGDPALDALDQIDAEVAERRDIGETSEPGLGGNREDTDSITEPDQIVGKREVRDRVPAEESRDRRG